MASGAIRGITVEIGGDTTKLGKALSEVNSKTKSLQSELKGVESLLKMDPSNVTLLTQKQNILTEAISNTKEKLNTLKAAQEQVQAQFDKGEITEEQYRDFQREIVVTEQKLDGLTEKLKEFGSVGTQQIAQVGEKMKEAGGKIEEVGKKTSVLSAGAGAVLGGSMAAFVELDSGYDTIITKTGATGEALEGLNSVADNIFASMPTDMDTVGTAVGEVNTRFGLTGDSLEELSTKFIQFAEINGVDLNNSIGTVDKILEQFNMDASESGGVLDLISAKAQETGISADTLMNSVQQNGATFKDMGIGVNEAIVLLSQFEANGVNVETAVKGLKKATQEYTDEGLSMEEALGKTIDSIKNAGSETEALAIAQEIFGVKGANEMSKAIREGRIDVDDLSVAMGDYAGTVSDTFNATLDPIDQGKVAMNNLKLAGSELGGALQTAVAPLLTSLVQKLQALTAKFSGLSDGVKTAIVVVLGIVTALGPVIIMIGKLVSSVGQILTLAPKIAPLISKIGTAFKALGSLIAAHPVIAIITAIIAVVVLLYNKCEWFRNGVNAILAWLKNAVLSVWEWIKSIPEKVTAIFTNIINFVKSNWQGLLLLLVNPFAGAFKLLYDNCEGFRNFINNLVNSVVGFFKSIPQKLQPIFQAVQNVIAKLPSGFQAAFQNVKNIITNYVNIIRNVFNIIKTVIQTVISVIKAIFSGNFSAISGIISNALNKIRGYFSNIFNSIVAIVKNWIALCINYIRGWGETFMSVFNNIKARVSTWWTNLKNTFVNAVRNIISSVTTFFSQLPGKIYNAISSAVGRVVSWGSSMLTAAKTAVSNLVSSVVSTVRSLPEKIYSAIQGAVGKVTSWGASLAAAAGNAIKNMVSKAVSTAKSLVSKFIQIGKDIVNGIKEGIKNAVSGLYDSIKDSLSGLVDTAKDALGIESPSKVFAAVVGKQIPAGIAKGVNENAYLAGESVEEMTDDLTNQAVNLNGATIKRQLATTFNAADSATRNESALLSKLDNIYDRLNRLQIVLDSGTLVGETIDQIDNALATKQLLSARGV